jgi:CubicO group peptidase (beta-lactamase class C family)
MNKVAERLNLLGPTIAKICNISGTPGASIGVTQRGEVIYKANFGYRDVEAQLVPDDSTVYHIASLTKGFSATAVGILVADGKLEWNTPLAQIIPGFHLRDKVIGEKVNSIDVLSHRMGIAGGNPLWSQGGNRDHLPKHELIRTIASLKHVKDFRDSFLYHNLGFGLVASVIEHVTGGSYGDFLISKIFKPLKMSRTSIKAEDTPTENRAKAYVPMDDGTFYQIPFPESADGTIQSSTGGVQSCVKDLLVFYNKILEASDPSYTAKEQTQPLAVHQGAFLTGAHNFVSQDSPLERTYALGFLRAHLPESLGVVGLNLVYLVGLTCLLLDYL